MGERTQSGVADERRALPLADFGTPSGDITEPFELTKPDQAQLWQESMRLGQAMKAHFAADKLNIAALGNQVAQLHVHHIARFHTDDAARPGLGYR
ncbi:MAG: hypothetical protein CM15mP74_29930 [Halieaceae bacterium]|nr:MAG: hypothetical protein CM15mP74_29930 [Halieaceae bacterium]